MMNSHDRAVVAMWLLTTVMALSPAVAAQEPLPSQIRFDNDRIGEVFRFATTKSPAFRDLLATVGQQDVVIYVEEGRCRHQFVEACLHPMPTPGRRNLVVRIDPRRPIHAVSAHLAHELYHASEIARLPGSIDAAAVRALYERIGLANCPLSGECWETRAALTFERLVRSELGGRRLTMTKPTHE
jgi:hypothetical protein